MSRIFFFFGWMIFGVAGTLVVFGHVMLLIVYDWAYFMETVWPSRVGSNSSLIMSAATFIPGLLILGMGVLARKFEKYEQKKGKAVNDAPSADVGENREDYVLVKNEPVSPGANDEQKS